MSNLIITPLGTVSPYSKNGKNCPGFLIEYGNNKIMLDCGNGCTGILDFPNDLNNLKVFISHLHPDHYGDLLSLMQAVFVYKKHGLINNDIEIYIPDNDTISRCIDSNIDDFPFFKTSYEHIIDYKFLMQLANKYPVIFNGYSHINKKYNDIKIETIKVPHQVCTYAFKITTPAGIVVYSADTGTSNNLREFAKNCDLFICESTFLKGQYRLEDAHLFAWEAASIAKDANVKKLLLTHFWPEIDKMEYLKEASEIFTNTSVAEEGKKLILKK